MPANPHVAMVLSSMQQEDEETLQKFESDLQRLCSGLGKDVLEFWEWPMPEGAEKEGDNVLVRESHFPPDPSVFPTLRKYFLNQAFSVLRSELGIDKDRVNSEDGWQLRVLRKVNKEVMKGKPATQHFVPVGAEIWLATPSHPANIIETWGGPFTFTEDGLNFKYHSSGILLRKAITLQHH